MREPTRSPRVEVDRYDVLRPWMMYGWHGWWPVMGLMWILPLLFLAVAVALVMRSPWWSRGDRGVTRSETAREVLERRYASGEITKEQFEEMKRTLEQ